MEHFKNFGLGLLLLPVLAILLTGFFTVFAFVIEILRATFSIDVLKLGILSIGGVGLLGMIYWLGYDFRREDATSKD